MEKAEKRDYVFSLDIGTRSIIGMVGTVKNDKLCILAIEKEEHNGRAMIDGQIEDIGQVAGVAEHVRRKLEDKTGISLECVHVAAAGRALKTYRASYEMTLDGIRTVTEDIIQELEAGAIHAAEDEFDRTETEAEDKRFYLVGYSVCQYYLDNYPISNLLDHKGKDLKADIIATFLPGEVVESLYAAMRKAGLEVAGMTLEPIASINAAIPQKLRLLNLVLVDIGAGTSDIAAAREGSISGYTMATIAGDEITETLMREYLIDFETAERLKMNMDTEEELSYTDVLGLEHQLPANEVKAAANPSVQSLCRQIADKVVEINGSAPSALFLVGGGSKLKGLREYLSQYLDMDINRIALGGNNFSVYAYSDDYELKDPEYSTPLGIAVSAAYNLINDSFYIKLNGQRAKLFRSGKLSVRDVLLMNGYGYKSLISHSGKSLIIELDGKRTAIHGGYATPAHLELNGKQAVISDLVKAGDEIVFEPARDGEDAVAKLSDVVELETKGSACWDGRDIPLGRTAVVNGADGLPDQQLLNGDKVVTFQMMTVEDFESRYEIDGIVVLNGQTVPPDWKLEDGDVITVLSGERMREPEKETEQEPAGDGPAKTKPDVKAAEEKTFTFLLNGKELKLKEKKDQIPYYLMDMLTHVDLDLTKPEGDIQLRINDEDAGFQNELKDGDRVTIRWAGKE